MIDQTTNKIMKEVFDPFMVQTENQIEYERSMEDFHANIVVKHSVKTLMQ